MCFSATASVTAGTASVAVGGLTVHRSQGRAELPLPLVPLLIGLRQLTEGVLWLSLDGGLPMLRSWSTYILFGVFPTCCGRSLCRSAPGTGSNVMRRPERTPSSNGFPQ